MTQPTPASFSASMPELEALRRDCEAYGIELTGATLEELRTRVADAKAKGLPRRGTDDSPTHPGTSAPIDERKLAESILEVLAPPLKDIAEAVRDLSIIVRNSGHNQVAPVNIEIPTELQPPAPDPAWKNPHVSLASMLLRRSSRGEIVSALLTGPSGAGKTHWARQFAAHNKRPFAAVEVAAITEGTDLFGRWRLVDGSNVWDDSDFIKGIQTPGCVVMLNEINRVYSERDLNILLSVMDLQEEATLPDGRRIHVAPGVIFLATANIGREFAGTASIDAALGQRFSAGRWDVSYLKPTEEVDLLFARGIPRDLANDVVNIAARLRAGFDDSNLSVRLTLNAANAVLDGITPKDALFACFRTSNVPEEAIENQIAAHQWEYKQPAQKKED